MEYIDANTLAFLFSTNAESPIYEEWATKVRGRLQYLATSIVIRSWSLRLEARLYPTILVAVRLYDSYEH